MPFRESVIQKWIKVDGSNPSSTTLYNEVQADRSQEIGNSKTRKLIDGDSDKAACDIVFCVNPRGSLPKGSG